MLGDTLVVIAQILAVMLLWTVGSMLLRELRASRQATVERRRDLRDEEGDVARF